MTHELAVAPITMEHIGNLSLEDIEGEIWKDVVGWEGAYQISNRQRVKSMQLTFIMRHKLVTDHTHTRKPRIIIPFLNIHGYWMAKLCRNYSRKNINIHRIVAMAFIPNPENKRAINHINGIKTDNRVENLEWCTDSENMIHALTTGLSTCIADNHYKTKFVTADVHHIRACHETNRQLADYYGVCTSTIDKIRRRINWASV